MGDGVDVGVSVGVAVAVAVGEGVAVAVAVAVAVGVALGSGDGVAVAVGARATGVGLGCPAQPASPRVNKSCKANTFSFMIHIHSNTTHFTTIFKGVLPGPTRRDAWRSLPRPISPSFLRSLRLLCVLCVPSAVSKTIWVHSKLVDGRPFGFPLSTTSRRKRSYMSDHEAPLAHGNPKGLNPL